MVNLNVDDTEAFEMMQRADAGDSEAQFYFARYLLMDENLEYREGLSNEEIERAIHYLQQSATKGKVQGGAAMQLGDIYYQGKIVPISYPKAIMWYRTAVMSGNPPAAFILGECAQYGKGMPVDIEEAIEWYLQAIKGYEMALIRLGDMYRSGEYFKADPALAFKLFKIAQQGSVGLFEKYGMKTDEFKMSEERMMEMMNTGEQNAPPPLEETLGELDLRVRAYLKEYLGEQLK